MEKLERDRLLPQEMQHETAAGTVSEYLDIIIISNPLSGVNLS